MRWLVRIISALVLVIVAMVALVFLLPADKLAGLASDQIKAATGREVTMTGRIKPSVWPQIGVSTGPVTLSNADWSQEGPMLSAEGLVIGVDLSALLGGDIQVEEVTLKSPRIVLEKSTDGQANWVFGPAGTATGGAGGGAAGGAPEFTIGEARIANGSVLFIDHAADTRTEVQSINAALTLPDYQGAARVILSAEAGGETLSFDGTLGQFGGFLSGTVSTVAAKVAIGAAKIDFDGRAGLEPLAADGQLDADLSDLGALFTVIGQPVPDLPAGVGKTIRVKGGAVYAPEGSVHLRDAAITLDANTVVGNLDLFLSGKPKLGGSLNAGTLDLRPFTGSGGGGAGDGGDTGWSTAPIDVSALGALDAEVAIAADKVLTGTATLGRTRILATLTDRRLVFDIRELRTHDGGVVGNFVVNGRGGLSIGGDLTVSGVSMKSLLAEAAGFERLNASGDLNLKFLGVGNSMNAIMNSLSGSGSFALGQGELLGLDLAGMLTHLDMSYMGKGSKTIFDSIGASFTIKDGVLQNDDLSFLAPLLEAAGNGKIRIGAQKLNYRVAPLAFGGDNSDGFKVPLIITGTWAKPKFSLDLEALAEQELDLERRKKELEEKAKAELRKAEEKAKAEVKKVEEKARKQVEKTKKKITEKVTDQLGGALGDSGDLEKNLEEQAKDELKKLLGGN